MPRPASVQHVTVPASLLPTAVSPAQALRAALGGHGVLSVEVPLANATPTACDCFGGAAAPSTFPALTGSCVPAAGSRQELAGTCWLGWSASPRSPGLPAASLAPPA